jgi:hypothetical protein
MLTKRKRATIRLMQLVFEFIRGYRSPYIRTVATYATRLPDEELRRKSIVGAPY